MPLLWLALTHRPQSLRVVPAPRGALSMATVSPGVYLLRHRLTRSHSRFEVHPLQRGLLHGPQCLQRYTCSSVAVPTATAPSEVNLLQHGLTHGCSPSRGVPALLWPYPWPHALRCSSMTSCPAADASRCTCCSMDLATATDASRCTRSSVAFSMGHNVFRDTPAPAWPYPQPQPLQK